MLGSILCFYVALLCQQVWLTWPSNPATHHIKLTMFLHSLVNSFPQLWVCSGVWFREAFVTLWTFERLFSHVGSHVPSSGQLLRSSCHTLIIEISSCVGPAFVTTLNIWKASLLSWSSHNSLRKRSDFEKLLSHFEHLKGFSPMWDLMFLEVASYWEALVTLWSSKNNPVWVKLLSHFEHLKGFSPVLVLS